jgi:hypothetical protein
MNFYGKLKAPQELFAERVDRMRRLIDANAPAAVIGEQARLIAACFRLTWGDRWNRWHVNHSPEWLLWLSLSDAQRAGAPEILEGGLAICPDCGMAIWHDEDHLPGCGK